MRYFFNMAHKTQSDLSVTHARHEPAYFHNVPLIYRWLSVHMSRVIPSLKEESTDNDSRKDMHFFQAQFSFFFWYFFVFVFFCRKRFQTEGGFYTSQKCQNKTLHQSHLQSHLILDSTLWEQVSL